MLPTIPTNIPNISPQTIPKLEPKSFLTSELRVPTYSLPSLHSKKISDTKGK